VTQQSNLPEDAEREVAEREVIDEPPPILGAWPRVYVFVLAELAIVIALFYTFTAAFRP
jgi:hypothetical protein